MNNPTRKASIRLKKLYSLLGGEALLGQILDDFYQRMARDLMIGYFFDGKDLQKIASQQKNFLLYAMGAVEQYPGKLPSQAHRELPPILPGHFDRRIRILEETLKDHALSSEAMDIWIHFESSFRSALTQAEGK
ncbi:MAG: group I truncated hemoglobin [Bdellovibrionia bacterium]